jgi:SNF2 family DNA or RNA helicase
MSKYCATLQRLSERHGIDHSRRGATYQKLASQTSRVVKGLRSKFALVLTGTPLENRLDDLHSVAEFVDPHALGADFRFFHQHRTLDADGKLIGYKDLGTVRERLAPILLRRTRASVRLDLTTRTVEIVKIAPTAEQLDIHDGQMRKVAQIVRKKYLTAVDVAVILAALSAARRSADSTTLVNGVVPSHSSSSRAWARCSIKSRKNSAARCWCFQSGLP